MIHSGIFDVICASNYFDELSHYRRHAISACSATQGIGNSSNLLLTYLIVQATVIDCTNEGLCTMSQETLEREVVQSSVEIGVASENNDPELGGSCDDTNVVRCFLITVRMHLVSFFSHLLSKICHSQSALKSTKRMIWRLIPTKKTEPRKLSSAPSSDLT
jgi:hypothetical protein